MSAARSAAPTTATTVADLSDWETKVEASKRRREEHYRRRKYVFVFFPLMALGVVTGLMSGWWGFPTVAVACLFSYALERWVR